MKIEISNVHGTRPMTLMIMVHTCGEKWRNLINTNFKVFELRASCYWTFTVNILNYHLFIYKQKNKKYLFGSCIINSSDMTTVSQSWFIIYPRNKYFILKLKCHDRFILIKTLVHHHNQINCFQSMMVDLL